MFLTGKNIQVNIVNNARQLQRCCWLVNIVIVFSKISFVLQKFVVFTIQIRNYKQYLQKQPYFLVIKLEINPHE